MNGVVDWTILRHARSILALDAPRVQSSPLRRAYRGPREIFAKQHNLMVLCERSLGIREVGKVDRRFFSFSTLLYSSLALFITLSATQIRRNLVSSGGRGSQILLEKTHGPTSGRHQRIISNPYGVTLLERPTSRLS